MVTGSLRRAFIFSYRLPQWVLYVVPQWRVLSCVLFFCVLYRSGVFKSCMLSSVECGESCILCCVVYVEWISGVLVVVACALVGLCLGAYRPLPRGVVRVLDHVLF